jgi:hypothetical protein
MSFFCGVNVFSCNRLFLVWACVFVVCFSCLLFFCLVLFVSDQTQTLDLRVKAKGWGEGGKERQVESLRCVVVLSLCRESTNTRWKCQQGA